MTTITDEQVGKALVAFCTEAACCYIKDRCTDKEIEAGICACYRGMRAALQTAAAWRPMSEATDRELRIIMNVGRPGEAVCTTGEGYYDDDIGAWCWSIDGRPWPQPTMWMPLPPPPEKQP